MASGESVRATEYPKGDMRIPAPVLEPGHDYRSITDKLTGLVLTKNTPFAWFVAAGIGFMITVAGATFQTDKVFVGVGIFALSGMIGMELLTKVERRFDKWRPQVGSEH